MSILRIFVNLTRHKLSLSPVNRVDALPANHSNIPILGVNSAICEILEWTTQLALLLQLAIGRDGPNAI
jgi:hypothetical protein